MRRMATDPKPRPLPRCPVCGRRASEEARPFCSPRCAQVDLGRWLSGAYAIPATEEEKAEEDEDRG
jgi:endogenous inhibitor of DNA gyrase (YacG/DUF329 family)